jgi:anti-anti-sigma factor
MFTTSSVTPSTQLHIDVRSSSPGTVRVAMAGEIDMSCSDLLRVRLLNVLSGGHPYQIEVDLTRITFLDCSGVTVLVVVREAAARTGCRLLVTNPNPRVRRILELTGLLGLLAAGFGQAPRPVTYADVNASVGILLATQLKPPLPADRPPS